MSTNEVFIETLEARIKMLKVACGKLINAVEQYVEPRPGTKYLHRSELLRIKNELKHTIK